MSMPIYTNYLDIISNSTEKIINFKENIGKDGNLLFSHSVPISSTDFLTGKMMSQWGVIGNAQYTKQNTIIFDEFENIYRFKLEFLTVNGHPNKWLKTISYKYKELEFFMESFFYANILDYNNIWHIAKIKNDERMNRIITNNSHKTTDQVIKKLSEFAHKSINNGIIYIYDTSNIDENNFIIYIRYFESYIGEAIDRISQLFDMVTSHLIENDYIDVGIVSKLKIIAENSFIDEMKKRREVKRRLKLSSFFFKEVWNDLPAKQDIKSIIEEKLIDI